MHHVIISFPWHVSHWFYLLNNITVLIFVTINLVLLQIPFFFNFYLFIYLFMAVLVFVSVRGLSLVAASGDHSSTRCAGLSLSPSLSLRSTGSRRAGSAIVAHGPSRSAACGIFPDQGLNPCPLHWQADSRPLRHQGSPTNTFYLDFCSITITALREITLSPSNYYSMLQ